MLEQARELRHNMTKQERHLWYDFLKNHFVKFYRQKPLKGYIADFYSRQAKLVIEIDGSQHYTPEGLEYDEIRTEVINSLGFDVIRFTNYEIDHNFDEVCEKINAVIKQRDLPLHHCPSVSS